MRHLNVITVKERKSWMPVDLWKNVSGQQKVFLFSKAERKFYRKREKVPVSDWATRHRPVTRGEYANTKFRKETVPYASGIMDASFHPSVEEIVMCAADQVAKSFIVETCIGYIIDVMPGPVLSVYPNENTSKENIKERYLTMIKQSPRLRTYLTGFKEDETGSKINLQHMQIYAAWASSAIQLANRSIKYLNLDEIDKYDPTAGKREASPIQKAEKRLRTYRFGRKTWKSSTPTIESGPIWVEINSCPVVFEFHALCPYCGHSHLMTFANIKWPDDLRDPEKVLSDDLAHYECPNCKSHWGDAKRNTAIRFGRWVSMEKTPDGKKEIEGAGIELYAYLKKYNPRKIGFHIPSWISPFVGLSEAAAAFLKGHIDKTALKDFNNSHVAKPWLDYSEDRKENQILLLCDDRPRGVTPALDKVACLTAGVDTQDNGFWYIVRAWGWGEKQESWKVRGGFVDSFDSLEQILLEDRYSDAEGNEIPVRLVVQDAMGHRTAEVYDFVRRHRGRFLAAQGVGTMRIVKPIDWSTIDFYPGGKTPIPGGLRLFRINVKYFKDILEQKLKIAPDDPGAFHLHTNMLDIGADRLIEDPEEWIYAEQMCSEYIDEKKQIWVCPEGKDNHYWDCEVYALAAAHHLGIKYLKKPEEKKQEEKKPEEKKNGWIPRRDGWLRG